MDDDIYEKYRTAGKIAAEIRDYGMDVIKPGVLFLDLANSLELKIKKMVLVLLFQLIFL